MYIYLFLFWLRGKSIEIIIFVYECISYEWKKCSWPPGDAWTARKTVFYSKRLLSRKINSKYKLLQFRGTSIRMLQSFENELSSTVDIKATTIYKNDKLLRLNVHKIYRVKI